MTSKTILAVILGILALTASTAMALLTVAPKASLMSAITGTLLVSLLWSGGLILTVILLMRHAKQNLGLVKDEAHQRWLYEKAIRDATLDALITINDEGEVLDFSSAAESTFGIKRQDAIGENIADLIIPHHYRDAHRQGMAHYNATGEGPVLNQRIEIEAMRSNGDVFPCELTVIPIHFENSTHFTAFVRDISERTEAQEALKKASQQAESASKAKTRFLTTMSHEMRSPLTSIVGALELLRGKLNDTEQLNWVSTAQGSCSTMLSLVNDVLDMSRIETGSLELNPVIFEPPAMLYSLNEIGQLKAREKSLSLCPLIQGPMPQTLVGDETRIRQIVTNLIDNAIKFTAEGYIHIYLSYRENDDGRGFLSFRVVDTGIGIADEAQQQLFDEFYQVDNSNTTPFDGTGLGLSIVKELVDMMGGDIQLQSEEGKGTDITVELPLARPPDSELMPLTYDAKLLLLAEPGNDTDALLKQLQLFSIEAQLHHPDTIDSSAVSAADRILVQDTLMNERPTLITNLPTVCFSFHPSTEHLYPFSVDAIDQLLSQGGDSKHRKDAEHRGENLAHERAQRTLLLAEDNKANQQVLVAMIQQAGYQIVTADNGVQAISVAQNQDIDMILMDMRMPELDGVSATIELRRLGFSRPIVAMTANAMPADISACIDSGMDDFLTKPVRANVLISLVDRWLSIGSESSKPTQEVQDIGTVDTESPLCDPETIANLERDVGAESIHQILQLFIEELEQAREPLSAPDPTSKNWRDIAHKIKSSAGFYGARRLYHAAHELEQHSETASADDLAQLVEHFGSCLQQTIKRYRRDMK